VRSFNTGPAGMIMVVVGLLLAGSSAWTAIDRTSWSQALPSILIGLSLVAVGYSLVARGRRSRSRSDGADGDEF
jgi:type IV secretory pathway VirB2 component (pilin)